MPLCHGRGFGWGDSATLRHGPHHELHHGPWHGCATDCATRSAVGSCRLHIWHVFEHADLIFTYHDSGLHSSLASILMFSTTSSFLLCFCCAVTYSTIVCPPLQTKLLNLTDFAALAQAMSEYRALAFYNCGKLAGTIVTSSPLCTVYASKGHENHLQP